MAADSRNFGMMRMFMLALAAASLAASSVAVARESAAIIRATPQMLPEDSRTTTIRWDTGDGSDGQVYLSDNGRPEVLFARGSHGSQEASWIEDGKKYRFRLYKGTEHEVALGETTVYGWRAAKAANAVNYLTAYALGAGTILVPLILLRLIRRRPVRSSAAARDVVAASSTKRAGPRKLRKIGFVVATNLVTMALLLLVGEYAMRWAKEGGAVAALNSFFSARTPESYRGTNGWLIYDAELGFKMNPAKRDESGNAPVNSLGIRNPEVTRDKPPGLFRIIVLGDSVAYSAPPGAPQASVVGLLQHRLEGANPGKVQVINACIPGYTTYQERRLLERDLLPLNPDLVILQYCLNDNHRFLHQFDPSGGFLWTREARTALTVPGDGWWARLNRSSYLLFEVREIYLRLSERRDSRFPWDNDFGFCAAWQDRTWPDFESNLSSMNQRLTSLGARLAVVAVPYEPQLRQDLIDLDADYTRKPQRFLATICERNHVPLLDLYPLFLNNRDRKLFTDGIHLTSAGTELTTDELLRFLTERGLVKDHSAGP